MTIEINGDFSLDGLTAVLAYLGAGMVVYWLTDGSDISWNSAWLLVCLVGWPLVAAFYVLKWALIAMVAVIAVVAIFLAKLWVDERVADRRARRTLRHL